MSIWLFLRLEICHSELSQKRVLTDESGLQEDGRTFPTECIPAVGHRHVVQLEEGAMYWKWTAKGSLIRNWTYHFLIGQREFSSDQGCEVFVKWIVQSEIGNPSLTPNRHPFDT